MSIRYSIYVDFDESDEFALEDAVYSTASDLAKSAKFLADKPVRVTVGDGIATVNVPA